MAITVPYTRIDFPGVRGDAATFVRRPYVLATLTTLEREIFRCPALIDSGADKCVFPMSVARILKLKFNPADRQWVIGVGGVRTATYYAVITVDLGYDVMFQTEVGFSEGLNSFNSGLLGQQGLFDRFDVSFQQRQGIFTIT